VACADADAGATSRGTWRALGGGACADDTPASVAQRCCAACAAAAAAAAAWGAGGAVSRWSHPRAAAPLRLLAAGGHDGGWRPLRSCEIFDTQTCQWSPAPPLPSAVAFLSAARAGDALVAVAGGTFSSCTSRAACCAAADDDATRPLLSWSPGASAPTPRVHAALAAAPSGALFLLGGRTGASIEELDIVERYRPDVDAWEAWHSARMPSPRASLGAVALADALLAIGGQAGRATLASVDALDVPSGRWTPAPPLRTARKYAAVASLRGCAYALGGMSEARARLSCCERLDPREGRWHAIAPLPAPRSSAAAAAAAGALFVGGNDGEATHASCARYDAAADAWEEVAPLGVARSGAALVAL
jgi:hypothetical protein